MGRTLACTDTRETQTRRRGFRTQLTTERNRDEGLGGDRCDKISGGRRQQYGEE